MKISLEWLREYAALDAPLENLVAALVDTGTEVDRVHRGLDGVVVARVLHTEPVPESDKGVIFADIDTGGDEPIRILTAAPNVREGQLVPYAQPGTLLPGWTEPLGVRKMFKKYDSPGMLCAADELGIGEDHDGIHILESGVPGQPIHEVLDLDVILDVEVTTNRPDCLCHVGIAREMAAALGEQLREPDCTIPDVLTSAVSVEPRVSVDVQDADGCPRFMVRVIEGVTVRPSPPWLQRRLLAIGLRPINNVVDVTNYVAHELGEPLHAFDYDKALAVSGGGTSVPIVVRRAGDGETIACLDNSERSLTDADMVVCVGDRAASIAGVIGGTETAVENATTTILLEAASWDGQTVRATSKRLGLRTDASTLFEKGLSDTLPPPALDRAAALIAELGAGHVLEGVVDVRARPLPAIAPIAISDTQLSALLGMPVEAAEAATALAHLGFTVEQDGGTLTVTPPHFRRDVTITEDVAEEVGRELGYERIPSTLPGRRSTITALAPDASVDDRVRDVMVGAGFDEAVTWSFVSAGLARSLTGLGGTRTPIPLQNPLSEEWSVLRTSCLPGVCAALAGNLNHGIDEVALFEIGRVFWEGERRGQPAGATPDNHDATLHPLPAEPLVLTAAMHTEDAAAAEQALRHLRSVLDFIAHDVAGHKLTVHPTAVRGLHPGRSGEIRSGDVVIGLIGEVDADAAEALELRGRIVVTEVRLDALIPERPRVPRFRPPARFPAVVHDLAVVVDAAVPAGDALAAVHEAGGTILDDAELYDEYRGAGVGPGRKSWTFRLTFRAADRTLTGEEAQQAQDAIAVALRVRCGAEVRGAGAGRS